MSRPLRFACVGFAIVTAWWAVGAVLVRDFWLFVSMLLAALFFLVCSGCSTQPEDEDASAASPPAAANQDDAVEAGIVPTHRRLRR